MSEDQRWNEDSKDLERLLSSSEFNYDDDDDTVDTTSDSRGLLEDTNTNTNTNTNFRAKRDYSVESESNLRRSKQLSIFLAIALGIGLYSSFSDPRNVSANLSWSHVISQNDIRDDYDEGDDDMKLVRIFDDAKDEQIFDTQNYEQDNDNDNDNSPSATSLFSAAPTYHVNHDHVNDDDDEQHSGQKKEKHEKKQETQEKVVNHGIFGNMLKLDRVSILAERNSGLSWFASELQACFPDVEINLELTRHSHWFQTDNIELEGSTMVVPLFLNAYHWVDTMRKNPHYMPNHENLEWRDFVTKPWSIERPKTDTDLLSTTRNPNDLECQLRFKYNDVISCTDQIQKLGKHAPVYELQNNGSGESYSNILHLRRDKIINWLSTTSWNHVEFVHPVQYELLTQEGGFYSVAKVIQLKTQTAPVCSPEELKSKFAPVFWGDLDPDYVSWMKKNMMWDLEYTIGYDKNVPQIFDDSHGNGKTTPHPTNPRVAFVDQPPAMSPIP